VPYVPSGKRELHQRWSEVSSVKSSRRIVDPQPLLSAISQWMLLYR
jgi:hypothetical protein